MFSGGKSFKLMLRISHILSWLIFRCRLLHPSSSEIQLWCCAVRVGVCRPIRASALGKVERGATRMGKKDSSSKSGLKALRERGRHH